VLVEGEEGREEDEWLTGPPIAPRTMASAALAFATAESVRGSPVESIEAWFRDDVLAF
jgi:hypothetical protein